MWYDATGLPWVRPSPNMPDLESASHYPGLVLFEGTNLSVGRGTPIAFQLVGAPWLDAPAVVRALGAVPGAVLSDTVVVPEAPTDGKYGGRALPAVRLRVVDRAAYDPVETALALLGAVHAAHPDSLVLRARMDALWGGPSLRAAVAAGGDPRSLAPRWRGELERFRQQRKPFLLYE